MRISAVAILSMTVADPEFSKGGFQDSKTCITFFFWERGAQLEIEKFILF